MTPFEVFFFAQVGFASLTLFPFLVHDWLNRRWCATIPMPLCPQVSGEQLPKMTVAICVRDEELVVAGKLSDLFRTDYPKEKLEVLVVDTGSSDRTMREVEGWIEISPDFGSRVRLLSTTGIGGKSAAVNLALAECEADSEVFVLTDADSRLAVGALERIGSWFLNQEIGAVCGRQIPIGSDGRPLADSSGYRTYYNRAREAESRLDSTAIFEGSLAAYRRDAINAGVIADSNADDSQLALETRKQGFRAIHDPQLRFYEAIPNTLAAIHSQRVRRAQGLVRHIWNNREMLASDRYGGAIRMTMRGMFHLHVLMPFCALFALAFTVGTQMASIRLFISDGLFSDPLVLTVHILNGLTLLSIITPPFIMHSGRSGERNRYNSMSVATSFTHAMLVLVWVHIRIVLGFKSHIWRPISEVREAIHKFDQRA